MAAQSCTAVAIAPRRNVSQGHMVFLFYPSYMASTRKFVFVTQNEL